MWNSYWREWVIDWSGNNYPNLNLTRKLIVDVVKYPLMRQKGDGRKARVLWGWCESGFDKQVQCGMTGNNGTRLKVQFSSHFLDCRHYVQHIQWRKMREITETRKTWHYAVCRESACALHCHYLLIILNELYKSIMPFLNFLVSLSIWILIF